MGKFDSFISWASYVMFNGQIETVKSRIPGMLRKPSTEELQNYCQTSGFGAYDSSVHWCGIFQAYLLIKAGVACHWYGGQIVDDSNGADLEIVTGKEAQKGLAIGDVVRVPWQEHHFMVLDPVTSGFIRSFEGNAQGLKYPTLAWNWMGNMSHNVVEAVYIRYRIVT